MLSRLMRIRKKYWHELQFFTRTQPQSSVVHMSVVGNSLVVTVCLLSNGMLFSQMQL